MSIDAREISDKRRCSDARRRCPDQPTKKIRLERDDVCNINSNNNTNQNGSYEEYKFINSCGIKINSECIYVPKQRLMYVKNSIDRYGRQTYICYNYKSQKCTARVVAISNNVCVPTTKTKSHTCVGDHKPFRRDCQLLRNIKKRAIGINKVAGSQASSVNLRAIIDEEKDK